MRNICEKILFLSLPVFLSTCVHKNTNADRIINFNLLLSDSITVFNTSNLPYGRPTVIIFFSPYCKYCQQETESILRQMNSLKKMQFCLVTLDPIPELINFIKYYKLSDYSNIIAGRDYEFSLPKHFKEISVPSTIIYDENKSLRCMYLREASGQDIINSLNDL